MYDIMFLMKDNNYFIKDKSVRIVLFAASFLLFLSLFSVAVLSVPLSSVSSHADGEEYAGEIFSSGDGSEETPYLIQSKSDLILLSTLVNDGYFRSDGAFFPSLSYKLTVDLDFSDTAFTPIGTGEKDITYYLTFLGEEFENARQRYWDVDYIRNYFYVIVNGEYKTSDEYNGGVFDPNATYYFHYNVKNAFFGHFDGDGHTISNLTATATGNAGLFGQIENACVENLTLENSSFSSNGYAGAIAALSFGAQVKNCNVLTCTVSNGAGVAAGGGVGSFSAKKKYELIIDSTNCREIMYDSIYNLIGQPHDALVDSFVVYDTEVSGDHAVGGIVGASETVSLTNCLSSVSLLSGQNVGSLGGTMAYSSLQRCLSLTSPLVGDGSSSSFDTCVYPSDLFTDETIFCSLTTEDLITTPLGGSFTFSPSSDGFYYQSPTAFYPEVTVYEVVLDENHVAYINALDTDGLHYILPESIPASGYAFACYSDDNDDFDEGDEYFLTGNVSFTTYYSLLSPLVENVSLSSSGVLTYNGEDQVAYVSSYSDPYSFAYELAWYRGNEEVSVGATLSVKNVSSGGSYRCKVTVHGDGGVPLRGENSASVMTENVLVEVLPKNISSHTYAVLGGESSASYTGNIISPVFSYSLDEPLFGEDEQGLSVTYSVTKDGSESEIMLVGTYTVETDISCENYAFQSYPTSFSVTPAAIAYTVTPYTGVYDGLPHFPEFSFDTVDGTVPTVLFSTDATNFFASYDDFRQTDVVNAYRVFFKASAENHSTLDVDSYITITPNTVTISPTDAVVTKIYDGSTAYSARLITSDMYAASYTGPFSGVGITVRNAYFASAKAGNTSLVVEFSPVNENFVLSNTSVTLGAVIQKATVTILPKNTIYATYNGGTNFTYGCVQEGDYDVSVNSSAEPVLSVYRATANSAHVGEANVLTVIFSLSGQNFVFSPSGAVDFDFVLQPKTLTIDTSYIVVKDRPYDGSVLVDVSVLPGALSGVIGGDEVSLLIGSGTISSPNASPVPYEVVLSDVSLTNDNYKINADVLTAALSVTIRKADAVLYPVVPTDVLYRSARSLPDLTLASGSVPGEAIWQSVSVHGGVIDFEPYMVSETEAEFYFDFHPEDSVNYNEKAYSYRFTVLDVLPLSMKITYTGRTEYVALEYFDVNYLTAVLLNNDGSSTDVTSDVRLLYNHGGSRFTGEDVSVTVYYGDGSVYFEEAIPLTVTKIVLPDPYFGTRYVYSGQKITFIPSLYNPSLLSITGNEGTEVGSYTAVVSIRSENAANYTFSSDRQSVSVLWSISPLLRYELFLSESSFVYTGEEIPVELRNDYNSDDAFYTVSGDIVATDAGEYAVTVSLVGDNYAWRETSGRDLVLHWTIRKKILLKPVIYNMPFSFDGTEHDVLTDEDEGYVLGGDLTYLHAGDFAITATLKNENNYVWEDGTSETVTLPYSVGKITVRKPTYTTSRTYNGASQSIRIFDTDQYTVSGVTYAVNAGDYIATVRLANKTDYVWEDGTDNDIVVSWYILHLSVSLPTLSGSLVYTGREQTALISYDKTYCSASGIVGTDVSEYVATIRLLDKHNTYWANGSTEDKVIRWRIDKNVVNIPAAPANVLYNGLEQRASVAENPLYTISGNVQKNVGTYNITLSLVDKINYDWSDGTTDNKVLQWKICSLVLSTGEESETLSTYTLGTSLASPYRDGYTFDGWYLTSDYSGEKVTVLNEINENTVLYAKWTKIAAPQQREESYQREGGLSAKAIAGIAVAGGSVVIALLIVLLGILLKRR